jgi:AcrR family transcriptional regulator
VSRPGRRPGGGDTRAQILAAARQLFAERGYAGASIRAIAAEAAVDPALVHHYFGTKDRLFTAVVQPPVDVEEFFPRILAGDVDRLGERIVRGFLAAWEGDESGPAFRTLLRSAVEQPATGALVRDFFRTQVVRRVGAAVRGSETRVGTSTGTSAGTSAGDAEVPTRVSLVAAQLFGLAMTRYVLRFEPLAGLPAEEVVRAVAPTIQRYLTGRLEESEAGSLSR